jgi:hypothetical protein
VGVSWVARYIPADDSFVVPEHTSEWLIEALAAFTASRDAPRGGLRGHKALRFDTTADFEAKASVALMLRPGHLPLDLEVEEYPFPLPELDYAGQRICRACGKTVPTLAACVACGVEEDPITWRIGPPLVLYRRSASISAYLNESALDLMDLPLLELDVRLRSLFEGKIESAEAKLGCGMRLVVQVLE